MILAAYANTTQSTAASDWTSRFFGSTGNLKNYYQVVSYGQVSFMPAAETFGTYADGIVGWVKVSAYNGPVGFSGDTNQVVAAIKAADPYVNFGSYDTNRDGRLEPNELHVTIIAAGVEHLCSTSTCGSRVAVNSLPRRLRVRRLLRYTIFGELQCNKNGSVRSCRDTRQQSGSSRTRWATTSACLTSTTSITARTAASATGA